MQTKNESQGLFIGFIGCSGVGKTSVASALAKKINAKVFVEPGEESWPVDHDRPWQEQVDILETWVCDLNYQNFLKARQLADEGNITVTDAGIFLVNKELIYTPSCDWWYGLMSKEIKDKSYQRALSDWDNAPCPDVLVLFEADKETYCRFLHDRGRSSDADETNINNYLEQKTVMAKAAEQFAIDRGISFVTFNNEYGSPQTSADELYDKLVTQRSTRHIFSSCATVLPR